MERNLEGDLSHGAPDWRAAGQLSSVRCHLDVAQYGLVRGLLAHNLGEKVEEFQRPLMSHLQDPSIQVRVACNLCNLMQPCLTCTGLRSSKS